MMISLAPAPLASPPDQRAGARGQAGRDARRDAREIVDMLNKEINAALVEPKIKSRLTELGGAPFITSPNDFGKFFAEETEKWGKVVRFARMKPE